MNNLHNQNTYNSFNRAVNSTTTSVPRSYNQIPTHINTTDTTNLRRRPIMRIPMRQQGTSSRPNPIPIPRNPFTTTSIPINNLPTLGQPEIRRSYDSEGGLDTVEMTFTNLLSNNDLNALFPGIVPQNTNTTNNTNPRLINNADDARVFLNLLDALSNSSNRNTASSVNLHDINQHTTISLYSHANDPDNLSPSNTMNELENDNICAICRSPYQENDAIRTLNNCNHYFHCMCIDSWLEIRNSCPSCRHVITEPSIGLSNSNINGRTNTIENISPENNNQRVDQLD